MLFRALTPTCEATLLPSAHSLEPDTLKAFENLLECGQMIPSVTMKSCESEVLHLQSPGLCDTGPLSWQIVMLNSLADLHGYIDKGQLTSELGGNLDYCHSQWIHHRTVSHSPARFSQVELSFNTLRFLGLVTFLSHLYESSHV